ncbi:MAG: hypothetical protein ACK55I_21405, partial [bacterium]
HDAHRAAQLVDSHRSAHDPVDGEVGHGDERAGLVEAHGHGRQRVAVRGQRGHQRVEDRARHRRPPPQRMDRADIVGRQRQGSLQRLAPGGRRLHAHIHRRALVARRGFRGGRGQRGAEARPVVHRDAVDRHDAGAGEGVEASGRGGTGRAVGAKHLAKGRRGER